MYQSGSAYREASLEGATHIEALTLVYEAIAADLLKAGHALQGGRIQERCDASNHALFLLGHLETWTEDLHDAALSESLRAFYGFLRGRIVGLQSKGSRADFEKLSGVVMEVKSTWEKKGQQAPQNGDSSISETKSASLRDDVAQTRAAWFA